MTERIAFKSTATVEGRNIRGSVTLKGARTWRNGEWVEVDPAALMKADASNVFGLFDHEPGMVLGRTTNGTLTFQRHEDGFDYEIRDVPNTTAGNDALELARGGYLQGSSFQIDGLRSDFSVDAEGTRTRRYTSIARLIDISPVFDPAFSSSTVQAFKESTVTDEIKEPVAAPQPEAFAAPVITPARKADDKSDTYRTAEAYAINQDLSGLESAMGNLFPLDTATKRETYAAFAKVYDERKAVDTSDKDRIEAFQMAHLLRTGKGPKAPESTEVFESDDYRQAFSQYLRSGNQRLMEQFAQSIAGDGTQGGFTVPDGFLARITERLKAFGGVARYAEELTTSTGESIRWGSNDDTGNTSAIAAEGVAGTAGADLAFDSIELGAFSYDANGTGNAPLKVSLELIQDSAFDIAGLVERKLGQRIGRKQASHFATGAGSTEPVGLFTKTADTMTATAVSLAAPEHILQVDSEYRDQGNCRWLMSDATLLKVWQSQTTTNLPLFIPGGSDIAGSPAGTLFGYPVAIDPAAGTKVAFGDIRQGYIVRRVRGIQLLVDPYTAQSTRQVAYHAWARADANINDSFAYSVSEWSTVSADT